MYSGGTNNRGGTAHYGASTVRDCNKEGHCLHPGSAAESLYCCKCGQYIYPQGGDKIENVEIWNETGNKIKELER